MGKYGIIADEVKRNMKRILGKIPAVIAMLISLISFFWYVQSFFEPASDIWIGSVIVAMLSVPFYLIDAGISLIRAIKKHDSRFNYILALVLIGAVPMVVVFGGDGKDYFNVIWNVYYLLMFALEVISIKKACAVMKAERLPGEQSEK